MFFVCFSKRFVHTRLSGPLCRGAGTGQCSEFLSLEFFVCFSYAFLCVFSIPGCLNPCGTGPALDGVRSSFLSFSFVFRIILFRFFPYPVAGTVCGVPFLSFHAFLMLSSRFSPYPVAWAPELRGRRGMVFGGPFLRISYASPMVLCRFSPCPVAWAAVRRGRRGTVFAALFQFFLLFLLRFFRLPWPLYRRAGAGRCSEILA